jgi:hypothetical protein
VIGPDDVRIIATSASRFGNLVSDHPPLIMKSLFPIGDEYVTLNYETGEIIDTGSNPHSSLSAQAGRYPAPRFETRASATSRACCGRASLGNLSRQVRPLTFVHNPLALCAIASPLGSLAP